MDKEEKEIVFNLGEDEDNKIIEKKKPNQKAKKFILSTKKKSPYKSRKVIIKNIIKR